MNLLFVLILLLFSMVICQKILFKANKSGDGRFQYFMSLENSTKSSLKLCSFECLQNVKCLNFFYNENSGKCILHSNIFKFVQPHDSGEGWKMYTFHDATSRCQDSSFLYYRELDLCFNINQPVLINYPNIVIPVCTSMGSELVKIDSQEKQTYFSYLLEGRPTVRVCIQGNSDNDQFEWRYNDGTPLVYANWRVGGPQIGRWYLQMFLNDEWTDQDKIRGDNAECVVICEKR